MFIATLPVQLFKGYRYYQYAMAHGGYLYLYIDHSTLAATVPFWVRIVSLIAPLAFVALFVVEQRRKAFWLATVLYFSCALPVLLLGSRMGAFSLILSIFYVSRVKSTGNFRIRNLILLALALVLVAGFLGSIRSDYRERGWSDPARGIHAAAGDIFKRYRARCSLLGCIPPLPNVVSL